MKNREEIIEALNEAIQIEHTLMLQCEHQALTVRGLWRAAYNPFFTELSDEARDHARKFGQKVVGLGGNPVMAVGEIKQSDDVFEMLEFDLELERRALAAYSRALALCEEGTVLRSMLEGHLEAETLHIEELERVCLRPEESGQPKALKAL